MAATLTTYPGSFSANDKLSEKSGLTISSSEIWSPSSSGSTTPDARSNFLVVSPYTEQDHLLDLTTLDTENALLAQALVLLRPIRADYATAPYTESFNWNEVLEELQRLNRAAGHKWRETTFFVVAFRSRIPPTTVYEELGALDKAAHAEATASGGFLKYWFGQPGPDGTNLATCVWRSQEDAKKGGVGPAHRKAAGAARHLYDEWRIDRHRLIVRDDLKSWEITDWGK